MDDEARIERERASFSFLLLTVIKSEHNMITIMLNDDRDSNYSQENLGRIVRLICDLQNMSQENRHREDGDSG